MSLGARPAPHAASPAAAIFSPAWAAEDRRPENQEAYGNSRQEEEEKKES